jgi:hypothetical protein
MISQPTDKGIPMGTLLNIISLVFSVLAIAVSGLLTYRQVRHMQRANLLPVIIELFGQFRTREFKVHLLFVERELWTEADREVLGTEDMPDLVKSHVVPVQDHFNTVGILLANNVIDDLLVASYMGGSVVRAWRRIGPYIYNERRRRGDPNYQGFFENLAAVVVDSGGPEALRVKLNLKSLPPG